MAPARHLGNQAVLELRCGLSNETRIGAVETRFAAQENRMKRALALLAHIASRIDGGALGPER
jgi:hypothetical protein